MSKYAELRDHLLGRKSDLWKATFKEIEEVLGFSLPMSARSYQAWWANQNPPSVQCSSWLDAGWRTSNLNLTTEQVTFQRSNIVQSKITTGDFKPTKSSLTWDDVLSPDHSQPPTKLDIGFSWHHFAMLFIDPKGRIAFPRTPFGPAVYRFEISQDGGEEYYIGETDEVSLRLQHYRTPGVTQRTNQRLNRLMRECLENGGTVGIAILKSCGVYRDGAKANFDLIDKHQRRLIESAAIVSAKMAGQAILNK